MRVSVICTVLNEAQAVGRLLDSLAAQSRLPDEVVVVDGGSSDGTQTVVMGYAERLPLKLQEARGANISRGRNLAVKRSTGDVIASTDAGVRLEPDWLERLVTPFEGLSPEELRSGSYAVAGFFQPDPQGAFELALGATTLPLAKDVQPERFLPSSRSVAFSRGAWQCSGGYPEWLDYCEDLLFDFQLIECCGGFAWAPDALVHFRPRPSLRSFFRQYYRYARGDGKAGLWRKRHAIRYLTYLIALPALLALSVLHHPLWLLALLAGVLAYSWRPMQRLQAQWQGYRWPQRLWALLLIPLIRLAGDVAKMLGYPAGLRWRRQNRARDEIHWRRGFASGRRYG
ncbi:MAG TPA: glycosyltransferase [Anaerolineae bacterium]|nr:glycosyltransferase [Anaerolineae bacterium]